jgi:hypothetical protein
VVSPAVDPNSTTVQVWVQAQHPRERLKPGITVHVSIVAETLSRLWWSHWQRFFPEQGRVFRFRGRLGLRRSRAED